MSYFIMTSLAFASVGEVGGNSKLSSLLGLPNAAAIVVLVVFLAILLFATRVVSLPREIKKRLGLTDSDSLDGSFAIFFITLSLALVLMVSELVNDLLIHNINNIIVAAISVPVICIIVSFLIVVPFCLAVSFKLQKSINTWGVCGDNYRLMNKIKDAVHGCPNHLEREVSSKTLFLASCAMNILLKKSTSQEPVRTPKEPCSCNLIISGDNQILKMLGSSSPKTLPYDLLHFLELQSLWANSANGHGVYFAFQDDIDKLFKEVMSYWDNEVGPMFPTMVDEVNNEVGAQQARAVRVLVSTPDELAEAIYELIIDQNLKPFWDNGLNPKGGVKNIWIPIDVLSHIERQCGTWLDGKKGSWYGPHRGLYKNFNRPPLVDGKLPYQIFANALQKTRPNFPFSEGMFTFMFLHIGYLMSKTDYHKSEPLFTLHNDQDDVDGYIEEYFTHFCMVIMAIYCKRAMPFMRLLKSVYKDYEKSDNQTKEYVKQRVRYYISKKRGSSAIIPAPP